MGFKYNYIYLIQMFFDKTHFYCKIMMHQKEKEKIINIKYIFKQI